MESAKELKVKITFTDEVLGMTPADKEIHKTYIASKAPDAPSIQQEIAAVGADVVEEKAMTMFPRNDAEQPIFWDYQIRGMFKDSCGMLKRVPSSQSAKIKAYKKEIDGLIFVEPRQIPIHLSGPMGDCQRPLRASTPQGERVALAHSETIPAGSTITFTVKMLLPTHEKAVREWLDYGALHGMGQWRNSGKGRYTWEEVE